MSLEGGKKRTVVRAEHTARLRAYVAVRTATRSELTPSSHAPAVRAQSTTYLPAPGPRAAGEVPFSRVRDRRRSGRVRHGHAAAPARCGSTRSGLGGSRFRVNRHRSLYLSRIDALCVYIFPRKTKRENQRNEGLELD
jgi:hypothetical protein